jgi:hypothetical protein
MREQIKKISIRARVAFIILCIENAVENSSVIVKWQKVFNVFWLQTSIQFVDEWLYNISKVMPESILDDEYEENDTLTHNDYVHLRDLYKTVPKYIFELMELAFECGTIELYGKIENESERTIQIVLKAVEIMKQHDGALPNIDLLQKFIISENSGWGIQFTREEIFNAAI